jgi:hypothetical protein
LLKKSTRFEPWRCVSGKDLVAAIDSPFDSERITLSSSFAKSL